MQLLLHLFDFAFKGLQLTVADFSHTTVVAFPLSSVGLVFQLLYFQFCLLDAVDKCFLALPFGFEGLLLFAQVGNLLVQLFDFGLIVLTLDGFALNLQLFQSTC